MLFMSLQGFCGLPLDCPKVTLARYCLGPYFWRQAEICQIEPGKFGIRISTSDLKETITQFIKNKLTRVEQVERYLTNRGYIRIK